ncbi:hypothetical protein Moror_16025 [Moniliophthora roreri MCA 2997]|uniref:Uncharacterized protein n=1 Tax=Moniliophthora roreri (strain MCA 2997) TaxID=1381753 RepID=V2YLV7_MONRO|nr:hypothetical protein Moror_16025 [Moniliophthora roreri MCA 2997]
MSCHIEPNSDISGIGVRVAIYTQALLSFLPAFLFTYDGRLDLEEEWSLLNLCLPLLVSSMALLITTVIQLGTIIEMSTYHILVVLNLMWMMNASALVLCVVPTLEWQNRPLEDSLEGTLKDLLLGWRLQRNQQLFGILCVSIHLTGMSALGLWLWSHNPNLDTAECFNEITTTYLFMRFPITDNPIRWLSFAFYILMAIPVLNSWIAIVFVSGISRIVVYLGKKILDWVRPLLGIHEAHDPGHDAHGLGHNAHDPGHNAHDPGHDAHDPKHNAHDPGLLELRLKCIAAVLLPLIIAVHTIIDTELTIRRNLALVGDENRWTFGQVIALLLVIFPLTQTLSMFFTSTSVGKNLWEWLLDIWHGKKLFNLEWCIRGILLPSQKWSVLHRQIARALRDSRMAYAYLLQQIDQLDGPTLPCVTASAVFSIASLLFIADQTLKITNDTFHPPSLPRRIRAPTLVDPPNYHLNHPNTEARVNFALKELERAITDARDSVSIAQCIRFSNITEQARYNVVMLHLRHLLALLDVALTIAKSLSTSDACVLRGGVNNWERFYHPCHFLSYGDAVGQMRDNLVGPEGIPV